VEYWGGLIPLLEWSLMAICLCQAVGDEHRNRNQNNVNQQVESVVKNHLSTFFSYE
jgi:hypothetical protein